MPTLTTCAGLILLSRSILDGRPDQLAMGTLDVAVRRNGWGSQVDSFEADLSVPELGDIPFRGVFIRAPRIDDLGPGVEVLSTLDGEPRAAAQWRSSTVSRRSRGPACVEAGSPTQDVQARTA